LQLAVNCHSAFTALGKSLNKNAKTVTENEAFTYLNNTRTSLALLYLYKYKNRPAASTPGSILLAVAFGVTLPFGNAIPMFLTGKISATHSYFISGEVRGEVRGLVEKYRSRECESRETSIRC
jgi:hypothetical protein